MKKIAMVLGLMASFFMFAGCASQRSVDQVAPAETGAKHKNFKGEVGGDK
jgi:hypothetical protein